MIITIGCEYGAGGNSIGAMVAKKLGIEYYDRDLVDSVVAQTGIDKDLIEKADNENNVKYRFDTKFGPRYANLTNKVIATQFDVIQELAEKGDCVFIGRCSDYILRNRNDVLNIFLYAPKAIRIASVMKNSNLSEKEATSKLEYLESMYHSRYKYMTGTSRGDRQNRHMILDSSVLGWEKTADYIVELVKMKFDK